MPAKHLHINTNREREDDMNNKLAISAILVLFSSVAIAASMPSFQELDTNTDGVLSEQEVDGVLRNFDFPLADKNGDGLLDKEEFDLAIKEQTGKDKAHKEG